MARNWDVGVLIRVAAFGYWHGGTWMYIRALRVLLLELTGQQQRGEGVPAPLSNA